jgi:GrpB-like predicted nucleotidyltransferase (UPF0157 family)
VFPTLVPFSFLTGSNASFSFAWSSQTREFLQHETFAHLFRAVRIHAWPVQEKIRRHRDALPEAEDPFRAEDRLPDRRKLDRQHDDAGHQSYREQEPILLEVGQRDQRDHEGGEDVAQGDRSE